MYDARIVTILSLENSLGSIGGVTVGNEEVVDHQRLSGAGYCFSASSPPFAASAAIQSLAQLGTDPDVYSRLSDNIRLFHETLDKLDPEIMLGLPIAHLHQRSPLAHYLLGTGFADGRPTNVRRHCLDSGCHCPGLTARWRRHGFDATTIPPQTNQISSDSNDTVSSSHGSRLGPGGASVEGRDPGQCHQVMSGEFIHSMRG